jgi:signal transduction histidine kinase
LQRGCALARLVRCNIQETTSMTVTTDAERLSALELSRVFKLGLRLRLFMAPLIVGVGLLFLVYDQRWQGIACIAVAGTVFLVALWEHQTLRKSWLSPGRIFGIVGSVLCVHETLVVVTGGITSPFVIVLPVTLLVASIGVGRARWVAVLVAAVALGGWILAVLGWTAPAFEPALIARGPTPPALAALIAAILTAATITAAVAGIRLRGALDRAVTSAAESNRELVQSMRERNHELLALAGALAHELKNPLSAIRGLAALQARRQEPGSKAAEQMAVLLDEVGRMGSILDELASFARPARVLALERVDPAQIVRQIVSIHEPLAAERGVSLAVHVDDVGLLACDPSKLKQILVNLLQNAIDASDQGGEVEARVAKYGDSHLFRIEDRGSGLSDAVRGRLFTAGATTKVAGSGLGLTIAHAIATEHGGTLTLSERKGGGCVAELRVPTEPIQRADGGAS